MFINIIMASLVSSWGLARASPLLARAATAAGRDSSTTGRSLALGQPRRLVLLCKNERSDMALTSKAALGRYSPAQGLSGPELPREGRRAGGKIEIVHGQEIDPFFAEGLDLPSRGRMSGPRRQRVAINTRTDTLEYEHGRGRLTPAAYATGRYIDAVLEAANGRRSSRDFGERHDQQLSPLALQHAMAARIDAGRAAGTLKEAMTRELGAETARLVVLIIGESLSFREIARMDARVEGKNREAAPNGKGRDCERAARRIGGLFRTGLEDLAVAWEKKGSPV